MRVQETGNGSGTKSARWQIIVLFAVLAVVLLILLSGKRALRPVITVDNARDITQMVRLGNGRILDMAWSPDGRTVAGASTVGIWLFDIDNLNFPPRLINEYPGLVRDVAFDPSGQLLASGGCDGTVRLWDVNTRKQLFGLNGHNGCVSTVVFSSDGKALASADDGGTTFLWDVETFTRKAVAEGGTESLVSIAFSPDGSLLAALSRTGVIVLSVDTGEEIAFLPPPYDYGFFTERLAFSSDGSMLIAGNPSPQSTWSVETKRNISPVTLEASSLDTASLLYIFGYYPPIGDYLQGRTINAEVGASVFDLQSRSSGWDENIAFSPDGTKAVAAYGEDWSLWDVEAATRIALLFRGSQGIYDVALSPRGDEVIASGDHNYLWKVSSRNIEQIISQAYSGSSAIGFLDAIPVVAGPADRESRFYVANLETGETLHELEGLQGFTGGGGVALTFSADGHLIAARFVDTGVWIPQMGEQMTFVPDYGRYMGFAAVSPDDSTLAVTTWDSGPVVTIWDIKANTQRAIVRGFRTEVSRLIFSNDGRTLAAAEPYGTILLWNIETNSELGTPSGYDELSFGTRLAVSPDGKFIAAMNGDGGVWLWEVATQTAIVSYADYSGPSSCSHNGMAFNRDGRLLVVGAETGDLLLMDTATGSIVRALSGHNQCVTDVAFSADGTVIASASSDGTVRLWHIGPTIQPPAATVTQVEIPASMWVLTPTPGFTRPILPSPPPNFGTQTPNN